MIMQRKKGDSDTTEHLGRRGLKHTCAKTIQAPAHGLIAHGTDHYGIIISALEEHLKGPEAAPDQEKFTRNKS